MAAVTAGGGPSESAIEPGFQLRSSRSTRSKSRWWRPAAALAAVGLIAPLSAALPAGASAHPASPAIRGPLVRVAWAPKVPLHTAFLGRVAAGKEISGAVALKPRNERALKAFISDVSNPHSSLYHQYLPRGAYRARFGPAAATVAAVTSELRGHGLSVSGESADGLLVYFHGTAGNVESAFHTDIARYRLPDGSIGTATTSATRLPASIAKGVTTVVGLDNLVHAQSAGLLRAPISMKGKYPAAVRGKVPHVAGAPSACAAATNAANEFGGLTDDQIANAYGAFGLYKTGDTGAGQAVDVFELEPYLPSDLKTFDTCFFGAAKAATMEAHQHQIAVDGGQPTGPGSGESILDVEDVAALAPSASINVYEAPNNTFGSIDEYAAIVNKDDAHVVTSSWAICEQAEQAAEPGIQEEENFLFEQAAAQGQSVFSAAGDTGNDECNEFRFDVPPPDQNPLSLLDPGSQPYVVSVGGTTIDDAATVPALEHVWNDGAAWGAGGGGISESWGMPSWQSQLIQPATNAQNKAAVTAAKAVETKMASTAGSFDTPKFCLGTISPAPSACRETPDVSAQADEFTGAVSIYSEEFKAPGTESGWITIGGTSSASPLWAAMTADINASSGCSTQLVNGTPDVGFVSPLLYAVAGNAVEYKASFNDITVGNNDDFGFDNGAAFKAGAGYDMASGLGSPRLTGSGGTDGLAFYVCAYVTGLKPPSVTSLTPSFGPVAAGTSVVITGTGFKSGSTPEVASVEVGGATASGLVVNSATQVTATFPAGSVAIPVASPPTQDGSGAANVVVTLKNGTSSKIGPSSQFEYVDENGGSQVEPSVTGVSPYGGSEKTPKPISIFGSGFSGTPTVSFGGVDASVVKVDSPFELTVTPPAFSSVSTSCHGGLPAGENKTNDICQVQVVVTETHGSSATATILPPYEGATLPLSSMAVPFLPTGCNCEEMPAPTEFDYVPNPTITSVSTTTSDPVTLASETGGTTITVTGKGFDPLTLSDANFGPAGLDSSLTQSFSFVSGTEIQLTSPGTESPPSFTPTVGTTTLPFSVATIAGLSASRSVIYAGVPDVTNLTGGFELFPGLHVGPDTGGTAITLTGKGFENQVVALVYEDPSGFSIGSQYTFTVKSATSVSAETLQQNPGEVVAAACTVTGCSNSSNAFFLLYPPGNPVLSSSSPLKGPAHGGTLVDISGHNLGCAIAVNFGNQPSNFNNATQLLDCGSTTQILAFAPPGKAGTTVKISVLTVESLATGFGFTKLTTSAKFTYVKSSPSPPLDLAAKPGPHSMALSWKPPQSTGGSPVTGYRVSAAAKGHSTVTIKLGAGARSVTLAGLAAGVNYTFTVSATSALGVGLPASVTAKPKA